MTAGVLSRIVKTKAIYPRIRAKLQSFPYGAYMFKKNNQKKEKKKIKEKKNWRRGLQCCYITTGQVH